METPAAYEAEGKGSVRVLFCIGVTDAFCSATEAELASIGPVIVEAFDDLAGRFGVKVLGTFDDDVLMMGASATWPWTAYILAEAPDLASVAAVTELVRTTRCGEGRLWRHLRVEARVGRQLFFGNA